MKLSLREEVKGDKLYAHESESMYSNPMVQSFHIYLKLHLLISELNDSKTECFQNDCTLCSEPQSCVVFLQWKTSISECCY